MNSETHFLAAAFTLLSKDLRTELRTRFGLNTVLAFVGSSLLVVVYTIDTDMAGNGALLWIVILFAALSSLSRAFVSEEEQLTMPMLRMLAGPTAIYTGKLLFNLLFTLFVNAATLFVYVFLLGLDVNRPGLLAFVMLTGTLGLSSVATLLGAIVSQASRKGALFAVISLPLLLPLMLIITRVTNQAFAVGDYPDMTNDLVALGAYAGVVLSASGLLVDAIWEGN